MKVLIIDDEQKARNLLHILLEENCKRIDHIFEAESLLDGVEIIKNERPQIVFLDIEMPENSGLEILDFVSKEEYNFEIIFTTAYSEYAIQAIQLSAIDYLLKPIRGAKVKEAVDKALEFLGKSKIGEQLEELKQVFTSKTLKKIGLPVNDGIEFVSFDDIIMMEADGMYTKISTVKEEMLISKPLKHFVELLHKVRVFYRPHRSYLINLMFIKKYVKSDGGYILMDNNRSVSISKERIDEFVKLMQSV